MIMLWVVLAALLGVAEWVDPEDGRRRPVDKRDLRTDAGWVALYFFYMPALATILAAATSFTWRHSPARGLLAHAPWAQQLAVGLAMAELAAYWVHRLLHTVPALWRIHSVHHSSTTVRWWSAFRFHPVDAVVSHGVPVIAAAACGAGPVVLVPYLAAVTVVTGLAHADVYVPGTQLRWAVVTPAYHRSHHELGRDDTNFALVLPLCDVLFRTASFTVGTRSFGSQRVSATPSTSEAMLAQPLAASATSVGTRRCDSIAASPITTASSVTTRAAARPIGPSRTG
jgi:lathosterol oxidase